MLPLGKLQGKKRLARWEHGSQRLTAPPQPLSHPHRAGHVTAPQAPLSCPHRVACTPRRQLHQVWSLIRLPAAPILHRIDATCLSTYSSVIAALVHQSSTVPHRKPETFFITCNRNLATWHLTTVWLASPSSPLSKLCTKKMEVARYRN